MVILVSMNGDFQKGYEFNAIFFEIVLINKQKIKQENLKDLKGGKRFLWKWFQSMI